MGTPIFRRTVKAGLVVIAVLCAAAGASAIGAFNETPTEASSELPTLLPVEVIEAKQEDSYRIERVFTGTLKAARHSPLSFESGGLLNAVLVSEGDTVAQGQELARLDTMRMEASRREVQAQIAEAAAVLAELRSGPRQEQIRAAQAQVNEIEQQLEHARARDERREDLLATQAISQEERDQTEFDVRALTAKLEAQRQRLKELQTGTRQEQIAAQEARLQMLQARADQTDIEIERSVLRAPFAGTISSRHADEGVVLEAGAPVVTLIDRQMEAWIGIPQDVAETLPVGASAEIEADGRRHPARVEAHLPQTDVSTRLRTVVLRPGELLPPSVRAGDLVRLHSEYKVDATGIWLPIGSLTRGSRGLWSCYMLDATDSNAMEESSYQVKRADLEIIYSEAEDVFVRGTLPAGALVVSSGAYRILPGQRVKPMFP